ncbi:MAG: type VI secretion system contractile sheath large subunit [Fuerstiella sp.]
MTNMQHQNECPFRLLILGDLSGRGNRGLKQVGRELAGRKTVNVDRDNFDEVMNRLGVELSSTIVDTDNQSVSVRFTELDDFEPDQLFESVGLFDRLRMLRQQLMSESTFAEAANEVRSWANTTDDSSPSQAASANDHGQNDHNEFGSAHGSVSLDEILSNSPSQSRWDQMISHLVDPLITAGPDPDRDVLVECVDAAIGESMRKLLHHPEFQRLESAWRGLSMLIRRLETNGDLQIHLLDISQEEIALDLAQDDVTDSGLYRLIVDESVAMAGGIPWSAIIGSDQFSVGSTDAIVLQQLAKIAAATEAPLIAGVPGDAVGCTNPGTTPDADDWQAPTTADIPEWKDLIAADEASFLQLHWPRFRIRLPYGAEARQIDAFDFEELTAKVAADHADYLWCSPAFAAALVLGLSFMENGWDFQPGQIDEVDDLPLCFHVDDDDEQIALPCAELWLNDRIAAHIRKLGITPLLSVKSTSAVRVGNFLSVNGQPLAGRWQ